MGEDVRQEGRPSIREATSALDSYYHRLDGRQLASSDPTSKTRRCTEGGRSPSDTRDDPLWRHPSGALVIPPPPADEEHDSPLDPETIQTLRRLGGPGENLLAEIIQIYLDDTPSRIEAMRAALVSGDAALLASAAHSLKSSSGNVGARRVYELCQRMETTARERAIDGAPQLFHDLEAAYSLAVSALLQL